MVGNIPPAVTANYAVSLQTPTGLGYFVFYRVDLVGENLRSPWQWIRLSGRCPACFQTLVSESCTMQPTEVLIPLNYPRSRRADRPREREVSPIALSSNKAVVGSGPICADPRLACRQFAHCRAPLNAPPVASATGPNPLHGRRSPPIIGRQQIAHWILRTEQPVDSLTMRSDLRKVRHPQNGQVVNSPLLILVKRRECFA